eukprot:scaffold50299_cov42-Phaeocystis_antarctica.AAC.1
MIPGPGCASLVAQTHAKHFNERILGSRINSEQHPWILDPSPSGRLLASTNCEPSHLNRRERALSDVAPRTYTTRSVPADFVARLTA